MHTLRLSQRLFLIALAALIPLIATLAFNIVSLRQAQEAEMHAQVLRYAQIVSLEMSQIVQGTGNLLRAISSAPVVQLGEAAPCADYVARIAQQQPQFVGIAIADGDGVVQCSSFSAVPTSVADRSYFAEALRTGELVIGEMADGRVGERMSLPIASPLPAGGPWSGGVVLAALDLGWLGARLKERDFAPRSALTIADRTGQILAREPFPEDFVGTIIPDEFQRLVRAEAPGTLELVSQDGTRRVIGYYPASVPPRGLYVSAGVSTEAAFAALNAATRRGALIAVASLALAFLLAWWTSRAFISRPVDRLLRTIGRWRRDDLAARTGMSASEGELGAVGRAVDEFMDELIAARRAQRAAEAQRELLLGELDHRVKNLLATVQAVARQSFRTAQGGDEAEEFLDRLRTMSSAHALLMRDAWQEAAVRELVETTIAPFVDAQRPQFALTGPDVIVNSRAALALGMALHELCTNAAKYGALASDGGRVAVAWEVAPDREGKDVLRLVWTERGGPAVAPPGTKGFGTRMIEQALAQQVGGAARIEYRRDGVVCTVTAPLAVVGAQRRAAPDAEPEPAPQA